MLLAGVLALVVMQRRFIYPAPRAIAPTSGAGFAAIRLQTADGPDLRALYRAAAAGKPTIVFFHGNGDTLGGALQATAVLAASGYGILLPEYRGYGGNAGTPSEQGLYHDGRGALAYFARSGVPGADVVLIGNSLGSGVAAQLASEVPVRALVILSGYTSLPDAVAGAIGTPLLGWCIFDRFDTVAKLARVAAPVLILHGDADRVISVEQGRALHRASPGSDYREIPGAGHELAYLPASGNAIVSWLAGR